MNNDFDDQIRRKLRMQHREYNPAHWQSMHDLLDLHDAVMPPARLKLRLPWLWLISVVLLLSVRISPVGVPVSGLSLHQLARTNALPAAESSLRLFPYASSATASADLASTNPSAHLPEAAMPPQSAKSTDLRIGQALPPDGCEAQVLDRQHAAPARLAMPVTTSGLSTASPKRSPALTTPELLAALPALQPGVRSESSPRHEVLLTAGSMFLYNLHSRSNNLEVSGGLSLGLDWVIRDRWLLGTGLNLMRRNYEIEDQSKLMVVNGMLHEHLESAASLSVVSLPISLGRIIRPLAGKPFALHLRVGTAANLIAQSQAERRYYEWPIQAVLQDENNYVEQGSYRVAELASHRPNFFLSAFGELGAHYQFGRRMGASVSASYHHNFYREDANQTMPNFLAFSAQLTYQIR